jgi:radical SAM superfamily enzyme YgiQ (UPF0313 family)
MTEYRGASILGNIGCFPQRLIPSMMRKIIFPRIVNNRATYALRKVEAKLIDEGFSVQIIPPQEISKIKKIKPKVVGISTVDPLTRKPQSWTLTTLLGGGSSVIEHEFCHVISLLHTLQRKNRFSIIVGGPGANEFETEKKYTDYFDSYVIGQAEGAVELFHQAVQQKHLPKRYISRPVNADEYSLIMGPARLGHVQVTIGCPRKCQFCAPCLNPWVSIPKKRILHEVETNLTHGLKQISLISDDLLLYGAKETKVNHRQLIGLIRSIYQLMKKYDVEWLNITDVSIAAAINGKKSIKQISDLLGFSKQKPADPIVGMETASSNLIKKYMIGKADPYDPDHWSSLVKQGVDILNDYYWYPFLNLIVGLPGETENDVIQTIDLIDDLKQNKLYFSPFFFVPMQGTDLEGKDFFSSEELNQRRWELLYSCWKHTIRSTRNLFLPVYFNVNQASNVSEHLKTRTARFLLEKLLDEIEKEIEKYRNDPIGLQKSFGALNIKNRDVIKLLTGRMMTSMIKDS